MAVASAAPEAAMLAPMDDSVAKPVVSNEAERAETPVVPAEGGEDEQKKLSEDVQKLTDEMVKKVDEAYEAKEAEIMQG